MIVKSRTKPGEPAEYFRSVVLSYDGDDCLIWPYGRGGGGYAMVHINGTKYVSRLVCAELNGPPPTSKHQAAHSCGKGSDGCVSPRHLAWKTRRENEADKLLHGTSPRGANCGTSKLTEDQVIEIRALINGGTFQRDIAEKYGVSRECISRIHTGYSWGWLSAGEGKGHERGGHEGRGK